MSLVESTRAKQLVAVTLVVMMGFSFVSTSQTPPSVNSWDGTWELNLAKSTYEPGPPPYKRSTCRMESSGDRLRVIYDSVGQRGVVTHLEWVGKLDGKDYPIQGIDDLLTNAYTRIDDRRLDVVVKADGVKVATARIVMAADGKSLTSVTSSQNRDGRILKTTTVYDRK